ncbi:MAG TPA: LysM peptidoglycan-binding domain-containing protein [Flavobacteriales bacterium]|nr:LysM peptidoglycan-binding domain-containing protein [Flavobacteriales bacterium]
MSVRLLGTLCAVGFASLLLGQEVRTVNGRKYTVHVVEAGQTLFAIARTNAVPVDVLLAVNPGAQDGLSIGEELLIPQDAVVKKDLKTAPVLRNGELVHVVRKKETLFGISRQYNVDINQLLERNPEGLTLQEGMELVIPVALVSGTAPSAVKPAEPTTGTSHTVQPSETLFSLGKRYGVDPEAIKAANGGLPEGLKAGSVVLIPDARPDVEPAKPVVRIRESMRYKVGMLLPFSISRNDSVFRHARSAEEADYYEPTRVAVQFYNGARMALDSLEKLGLYADVSVLDMGDGMKDWSAVTKRPDIQEVDLFIGPFHRTAIEQLARANSRAHIVCPVQQSNKVILGMPTVSKVTPTRSDMVKHAARYVGTKHANANIVLLRPDIASEKDAQEQARNALNDALRQRSDRYRDTVLVAKPGKKDLGDLTGKLDAARLNVIVAPSDDVEFVTNLVTKLKGLSSKHKIRVVGMESWYTMPSVAISDLEALDLSFAAATFIDQQDPRVRQFTMDFRDRYKADVDEYALLGFDVTFYYLKALHTEGLSFSEHFAEVRTEPLHMGFRMTRTGPENGFRNEFCIMLEQEDMQLVRAQ